MRAHPSPYSNPGFCTFMLFGNCAEDAFNPHCRLGPWKYPGLVGSWGTQTKAAVRRIGTWWGIGRILRTVIRTNSATTTAGPPPSSVDITSLQPMIMYATPLHVCYGVFFIHVYYSIHIRNDHLFCWNGSLTGNQIAPPLLFQGTVLVRLKQCSWPNETLEW